MHSLGTWTLRVKTYHAERSQLPSLRDLSPPRWKLQQLLDRCLKSTRYYWVALKDLDLSYYIGETLLFTIYTHDGNLN